MNINILHALVLDLCGPTSRATAFVDLLDSGFPKKTMILKKQSFDKSIYRFPPHCCSWWRFLLSLGAWDLKFNTAMQRYLQDIDALTTLAELTLAQRESSIRQGRTRRLQVLILEDNRWTLQAILGSLKFVDCLLGKGF